jgi:hypothetical protein
MNTTTGPVGRRELTRTFRCRTMDAMHAHWQCPGCGAAVSDPNVYAAGSVPYDTVEQLRDSSRQALAVVGHQDPPRCPGCGLPATLRAADYHAYHTERGIDLVMRWSPGAALPERLWWDGQFYRSAELTEADCWCITGDAYLRRAAVKLEVEGLPEALSAIVAAQEEVPGDPELLAFIPELLEHGHLALARDILDEYTSLHPEDEQATALLESLAP